MVQSKFNKILDRIVRFFARSKENKEQEIIFFAEGDFPDENSIVGYIDSLRQFSGRVHFPKNCVVRSREHVISWFLSFLRTERMILNRDFNEGNGKGYEIYLLRDMEKSRLILRVCLKTIGVSGGTSYDISLLKHEGGDGDVSYICVE